jgi:hypothetical protein
MAGRVHQRRLAPDRGRGVARRLPAGQDLDRDLAVEVRILRRPDFAHPTAAEAAREPVATAQDAAQREVLAAAREGTARSVDQLAERLAIRIGPEARQIRTGIDRAGLARGEVLGDERFDRAALRRLVERLCLARHGRNRHRIRSDPIRQSADRVREPDADEDRAPGLQ